jgi:hypothetical protein
MAQPNLDLTGKREDLIPVLHPFPARFRSGFIIAEGLIALYGKLKLRG